MDSDSPQSFTELDLTRPGIIEASAGTGKTFAISEIYLSLLRGEKTYRAGMPMEKPGTVPLLSGTTLPRVREILVVTFTDAATAELRARLRKKIREMISEESESGQIHAALKLADAEFDEASVFTIHGFCLRVLKEFGLTSRTEKIRSSLSDELKNFVSRRRARKIAEGESVFSSLSPDDICAALRPFLQNPDIVPVAPRETDTRGNALFRASTQALPEWLEQRERAPDISYSEILIALRDALRRDKTLSKRISARFRVALVDEFQDTDPVQWEIFRRIFIDNQRPVFCVGDPKQAIYEFRGGDIHTYRRARKEILETGRGNVLTLGENWRSAPSVIAAFNEIFNFDRRISHEINVGTFKKPEIVTASVSGLLDYSPVKFPAARKKSLCKEFLDTDENRISAFFKIEAAESSKDRAKESVLRHIVADIVELVKHRCVPAHEIAVLVSDNHEANRYRFALARENVPASTTARGNVLCEPVAAAVSDILHAVLEPQNTAYFRRALLSPFFTESERFAFSENTDSVRLENVRRFFADAHSRWKKNGILSAFRRLCEDLDFSKKVAQNASATLLVTNVLHLSEILHATEQKSALSPRALLNVFDVMRTDAKPDDDSDEFRFRADSDEEAVRILTVHKSKGLEFEIVFVPSLWAKPLYSGRSADSVIKGFDEDCGTVLIFDSGKEKSERFLQAALETASANAACLFYVALTRARSRLVVYHVPQIPQRGVWNSYQGRLLSAVSPKFCDTEALPHWSFLAAEDPLPKTAFPRRERMGFTPRTDVHDEKNLISGEVAQARFELAENVRQRLQRSAENVFSFSKIIHSAENESSGFLREDDDAGTPENDESVFSASATKIFPKTDFYDLPCGAEFGTIVHSVFEKANFLTQENLASLAESALRRLPNLQNTTPALQGEIHRKFLAMVKANLALPLFPGKTFRLETLAAGDVVHEMEFHFPLKRSRNLYAELARIFKSWGGIYAQTADYHWAQNGETSSLDIAGMMTGIIDLVFRTGGKFFILDWKTNIVVPSATENGGNAPSEAAIINEIVVHGYALQWTLYALALRNFLKTSLGENYVHDRDFGGVVYLFVRWCIPFLDTQTLTEERLDELEKKLADVPVR